MKCVDCIRGGIFSILFISISAVFPGVFTFTALHDSALAVSCTVDSDCGVGDACTQHKCFGGSCVTAHIICPIDRSGCVASAACDPAVGCVNTPNPDGTQCSALNGAGVCVAGACSVDPCDALVPTIKGTDKSDVLVGTKGNDVIFGYGGNDLIIAGDGDDIICAGDGNDVVFGGKGADKISRYTAGLGTIT